MDELLNFVADKAEISKSPPKKAVTTVMGFLDKKLLSPIDSQVKQASEGGQLTDVVDDALKGFRVIIRQKRLTL